MAMNLVPLLNGCLLSRDDLSIIAAGEEFLSFSGYNRDEIIGKPFCRYWDKPEPCRIFVDEVLEQGSGSAEGELIMASGIKWCCFTARMLEDGRIYIQVCDLSEFRNRQQEYERINRDLLRKNNELEILRQQLNVVSQDLELWVNERTREIQDLLDRKDAFINQLGHDLRTPLTPLVALLPKALERAGDPKSREYLEISILSVQRIRRIVEKTITLAKLNSRRIKIEPEQVRLKRLVDSVIAGHEIRISEKNISVTNRIPENVTVTADRELLHELMDNLLGNAIKYIEEPSGQINIDAWREWGTVHVYVRDNGIGMVSEDSEKAFNEFFRADSSRHDAASFGLGLAICKRIIELHNGRITIESPGPGQGTTVTFSIKDIENPESLL